MMMKENRFWKNLLLVLFAVSFSATALLAQCTTGLGTGNVSSQGLSGQPWRQSFQVGCTGQLTTIVLNPTNSGSAIIDEITPIDNVNTSLRLLNSSNVVIANATINGLPHTNTWGAGNTYMFDFSSANVTLNANTTYSWELYNVELNSNQPIDISYLAITNLTNPYALGNANVSGLNYSSADIHNWTVNVVAACTSPVITTQPTNVTATVGGTANFNVSATGTNLTYQWQYATPGSSVYNDIVSATGSSYTAPASNIGRYRVKVYSNGGCEVISNPATLTSPDYFVLQFTGATSYVFSSLTAGNVNYAYVTKNGISGTGSFNQATLAPNNTTVNTPAVASTDTLTLVIEPTNLRQVRMGTNSTTRLQIYNVKQWGNVNWTSHRKAFEFCNNLKINATDIPDFNTSPLITCMFRECFILDSIPNINNWNVSAVQRFDSIFDRCHEFDGNLSNWNMSSALSTSAMFSFAGKYNNGGDPGINNWNMSNVTNMVFMFSNATIFNQPIGNWDVSNVVSFGREFQNATSFNQDISNWDVSKGVNFQRFLVNATAFNQNLGKWKIKTATVNLNEMFGNCGMSCANYSATLIGWASNPNLPTGRGLGSAGRIYGTDAQAARTFLTTSVASGGKGWFIVGDSPGGSACIPVPVLSAIPNQETCDGQSISNIPFTLGGDTTNVVFTTLSSNPAITPTFTFNGTANSRTLNIATTAGQIGATTISIIATNSLGGKDTISFTVTVNQSVVSTTSQTNVACFGKSTGVATVNVTGGSLPYTYVWTNSGSPIGSNNSSISGLAAGTYSVTVTDNLGCSTTANTVITEPLAIVSSITQIACNTYTLNGQTYTTSGVYIQNLTNVAGCDSTLTLNLTINMPYENTTAITACDSYVWNGQTYTTSGMYVVTNPNLNGCDSTEHLNLTIVASPTAGIEVLDPIILHATGTGTYQWIDCTTGQALAGETDQNLVATYNGSFAVVVSNGNCSDTSACEVINTIGLSENNGIVAIQMVPNPTSNDVTITWTSVEDDANIVILDAQGKEVLATPNFKSGQTLSVAQFETGMYLVVIKTASNQTIERLIKQ